MSRCLAYALFVMVIPQLVMASQAEDMQHRALFRFLFPDARIELHTHGATISDRIGVVRAERAPRGWRIFLPDRRVWEADRIGQDGWRVRNERGQAIELRPQGHALLAGSTFEGRRREVRQLGQELHADHGLDAYFDHLHREQERKRRQPKGLQTRPSMLDWRRD